MLESFLISMSIPTANLSMHNVLLNKCSLLKVFCILEIIRSKRKGGGDRCGCGLFGKILPLRLDRIYEGYALLGNKMNLRKMKFISLKANILVYWVS